MTSRDPAQFNEASYETDPAAHCDTLRDHVSELVKERMKPGTDEKSVNRLTGLVFDVVRQLLVEGRAPGLVDVQPMSGRELLAKLIAEIIDAPNPRIMACSVDVALGLCVQAGKSETQIAEENGVTKATVSRLCCQIKETYLGGMPGPGMKSTKAVLKYRDIRLGRSSRPPREEWTFLETLKESYEQVIRSQAGAPAP